MALARRRWMVILFFTALVLLTRLPLAPHQLFTFDDVNLAYSLGHFDVRISQPQPPGYPLFVMEMRALSWLRFRRAENILLTLAVAGSASALLLLVFAGDRIMGGQAGLYAALLFALNPVFWHSGVVSALRIQLAIASLAVAVSCWFAWQGDRFWVPRSAIVLGLAAGIRPETGPLLFPLWAASAWRARVKREDLRFSLGAMAVAVLAWLAPTMWASGGPLAYVKACLSYLNDQAAVTSGLFGSQRAQATFWHLVVWTMAILPACALPAVIAWRGRAGWEIGRARLAFLALWFTPPFVFACLVHIEDPGQALGMTVAAAMFGGFLIQRALDRIGARVSTFQILLFGAAAFAEAWILDRHDDLFIALWTLALALAVGLCLKLDRMHGKLNPPAFAVAVFLLVPALLNLTMFTHPGWYYHGAGWSGEILEDVTSGLALSSLEHIRNTLAIDDHAIRDVKRLAAQSPGRVFVIWERGPAAWRKLAYYAPEIPIAVLERRHIGRDSPPVATLWKGARRMPGPPGAAARVDVPAGARIVWLINPRTTFYSIVERAFAPRASGSVLYADLPLTPGSVALGEYVLAW